MIRIALADDHEMFRTGLRELLSRQKDIRVMLQAKDGEDLLEQLKNTRVDCAVVDLSMPNMDGLVTLKEIALEYPHLKTLVLTMQKDMEHFKRAMATGARGYILKDCAFDELVLAIRVIMKGKTFVSSAISEMLTTQYIRSSADDDPSLDILTKREKEVLCFIAQGLANKNIATKLKISSRTVEAHRSHLTQKLGLKTPASLVKYAISKGLA